MTPEPKIPAPVAQAAPGQVEDHRPTPSGVLPRRVQTWLMAGLALVIVLIILVTGHPQPTAPHPADRAREAAPASPATVERYSRDLDARDRAAREATLARSPAATSPATPASEHVARPTGPDVERERRVTSLFADNVVSSRRPPSEQPTPDRSTRGAETGLAAVGSRVPSSAGALGGQLAELQQAVMQLAAAGRGSVSAAPAPIERTPSSVDPETPPAKTPTEGLHVGARATSAHETTEYPAEGPRVRLLEGTVIETVLVTRLNGALAGPVTCQVTTPVYSADRQHVLIPAGARLLGSSAPVQSWGDSRLAVSFHRLVMPDGHTYSLDAFRGLDQVGETGVTETVNRHYLQVFGASVAIGALSGLAQLGTTSGLSSSFGDEYRQAAGASLAASTSRVLDRYLNVLPTITIREGYRIKVYLTNDFELPVYPAAVPSGGHS